ncbi:MAG: hypothetical protein QW676_03390 [Candidatus Aenigmatarchaeota archaeon]
MELEENKAIYEVHLKGTSQYLVNPEFLYFVIEKGPYKLFFYLLTLANIQGESEVLFFQDVAIKDLKISRATFFRWYSFLEERGLLKKALKEEEVKKTGKPKWPLRKVVLDIRENVVFTIENEEEEEENKYYLVSPEFLWIEVVRNSPYRLLFYFLDLQNKREKKELILYQDEALEKFNVSLPTFYRWVQFLRDNNLVRQLNKFTYSLNLPYLLSLSTVPQKKG